MTGLVELRLSNNRIIELPPTIGNRAKLRELYLQNNALSALPRRSTACDDSKC